MTIASTVSKTPTYACNGVTTSFPYGFRVLSDSDMTVILVSATNAQTILTLGADYTLTGVGSEAGGSINTTTAYPAGNRLIGVRNPSFLQSVDLQNQGAFFAQVIEDALDLAVMRDQKLLEELERAVKVPVGRAPMNVDEAVDALLRFAEIYQGSSATDLTVRFDGSPLVPGDLYYNTTVSEYRYWSGSVWTPFATVASIVTYRYVATAGQTVFSGPDIDGRVLSSLISGALFVHLNGVSLIEGVDFDITGSGASVTLAEAAALSDEVVITKFQQITLLQLPAEVQANANLAADWAQKAEDSPVLTGPNRFSALHHAAKAAASAAAAAALVAAIPTVVGDFVGTGGAQTLTNKTLSGAILNDGYTEEVFAIVDGATVDLDPNNGSVQTWTLGANRTPGQANWAAGQSITLMIDDGSARTITWSTLSVVWKTNGGSAPTLNTTGITVISLWKVGTTIYGARVGDA